MANIGCSGIYDELSVGPEPDAEITSYGAIGSERERGTVIKAGRGLYTVHTDGGQVVACRLRGNLKKLLSYPESPNRPHRVERVRKRRETDPVAVGDRVRLSVDDRGSGQVIETVEPRIASFSRRSGNERERQTIVANLQLAVIVFAALEPRPDLYKLDRFLVLAEDAELACLIVFNKADLVPQAELDAIADEYRNIGYRALTTSVRTGAGIDELRSALVGRISAFAGPSGVGKSTLLNAIQPGLSLRTGEVGATTFKGRHTTTASELLPLSFGGWVADTPGLRQVEFWDLDAEDVGFCFPEIAPQLGLCRFANCRHRNEPGCAIRAAVEAGDVAQRRYESYLEMIKPTG